MCACVCMNDKIDKLIRLINVSSNIPRIKGEGNIYNSKIQKHIQSW